MRWDMEDNYVRVIIALCGTATGAVGLKLLDKMLPDATKRTDDQAALRKELREDATSLRAELRKAREDYETLWDEHTEMHRHYAELKGEHVRLQFAYADLDKVKHRLEEQFAELRDRFDQLMAAMMDRDEEWRRREDQP